MKLIEATTDFHEDRSAPGTLIIDQRQEVPDDFLSDLKKQKIDSDHVREKEFMHVASIPVLIHEKWVKEGFDCTKEPIRETVKRLHAQGLDAFLVTNKRI